MCRWVCGHAYVCEHVCGVHVCVVMCVCSCVYVHVCVLMCVGGWVVQVYGWVGRWVGAGGWVGTGVCAYVGMRLCALDQRFS